MPEDHSRGVFAISVAAEMVSMQVQNLRVYERRGLLEPDRTTGGTRLYSRADIETLHRIRDLLADGLNLAGIARVLELEAEVARLRHQNARLRASAGMPGRG
ncbi:MerR family transcriptional regulator [Nocardioides panaciterrulae]|uniref:DNA-binding transcriptional MerR regulator n=1 Tax=Nocardioides panaciterrulae TaxID=661492 RepID=A0A7Y9E3J7_9ACTN|nr:MerR family transcriptional regulator [Nocardioides panaciterrulae]NYD40454.1 DNA-binding transcriptional MerR regulator [Nocardioides panaciterrulae]